MRLSLGPDALADYLARQLWHFFPDRPLQPGDLRRSIGHALERLRHCFERVRTKYYSEDGEAVFDHLNTDHYAAFLYFASREARAEGDMLLAAKLYALNKALHAVDIFYEVELPSVFLLRHPVGTVLGRAKYADYLCVYQNCVVGQGMDGGAVTFDGPCVLFGGAQVVGACEVGANAWIAIGTLVVNRRIPADSVVRGRSPDISVEATRRNVRRDLFET